jgi:WXG100 family type VII secretion target
MADPDQMRSVASLFDMYAQIVQDEALKMWASSQNSAGTGCSGRAQASSRDTMGQINQALRNILNMLHGVRDGLIRDADIDEQQEQVPQQTSAAND